MNSSKRIVDNIGNCAIFSKNLRNYLKEHNKTQREAAAALKVSKGTMCDWCRGRAYPRMDKLELLANYFGIEKSDLIEEHDVSSQYFLKKEASKMLDEMLDDPDSVALFRAIQNLSPSDKKLALAVINRFNKQGGTIWKK